MEQRNEHIITQIPTLNRRKRKRKSHHTCAQVDKELKSQNQTELLMLIESHFIENTHTHSNPFVVRNDSHRLKPFGFVRPQNVAMNRINFYYEVIG